jgi:hypothetical protein
MAVGYRDTDMEFAEHIITDRLVLLAMKRYGGLGPGKAAADVARLLREQRPLTAEEKAWVEKSWQEYKASAPKI